MANTLGSQRLFRQQALRAGEFAWQGQPALVLGLPATATSFVSIVLIVASAALIMFGSYARRVDLQGTVLPNTGLITISAPSSARIESLAVKEGEPVERGTPLYSLDVDTATKDGGVQQAIADVLVSERDMLSQQIVRKTHMSTKTKEELHKKIISIEAQIGQLNVQIDMEQGFFKTINAQYDLFRTLLERRQASLNEFGSRQKTWMEAQSKLQGLESNRLRLKAELHDAQYQLATIETTSNDEIDALKGKIGEINEKLATGEARRSIVIHAPGAGVVTAIVAHPGQEIGSGAPMLKIVPQHTSMQAHLLAPSSAIGFIHPDEHVLLRYSAFPYQRFGEYRGRVVTVSHAALTADEAQTLLGGATSPNQSGPFYRVIVEPDSQSINIDGADRFLPASMQVQAYVLLDRRPLYSWILQPVYDIARAAHGS